MKLKAQVNMKLNKGSGRTFPPQYPNNAVAQFKYGYVPLEITYSTHEFLQLENTHFMFYSMKKWVFQTLENRDTRALIPLSPSGNRAWVMLSLVKKAGELVDCEIY